MPLFYQLAFFLRGNFNHVIEFKQLMHTTVSSDTFLTQLTVEVDINHTILHLNRCIFTDIPVDKRSTYNMPSYET